MKLIREVKKEWGIYLLLLFLLLILALLLRVSNLNELPIFADEAIYIRWAQVMRAEPTLRFLPLSDGKQPLFMWGIIPFLKIISDPLLAGRMVSIATGLATMLGVFSASYLLFKSKKAALVGALIYTLSPYMVFFDRIALVDSMLSMFGVWIFVFLVQLAKTPRLDLAMIAGFALGGALLTKSPALFFVILLPTTLLVVELPKKKDRQIHLVKLVGLWIVMLAIGYTMYNVLKLGPNVHLGAQRNHDYVNPISHLWTNPLDPFVPYMHRVFLWIWGLGPSMVLLLALVGIVSGYKKELKKLLLLCIWFILPVLVVTMFAKSFTTRYILFTIPYLIILASSSFSWTFNKWKYLLYVLLISFVVVSICINHKIITNIENAPIARVMRSGYLEEWTSGTGIKEVSEYIRSEYAQDPSTKIVVGTEGYFGTLPDALQIYLNDIPQITVVGVGLSLDTLPDGLAESAAVGSKTYLVVNKSRLAGDPDTLGLTKISEYEKAERSLEFERALNGPRDSLYLFRVE